MRREGWYQTGRKKREALGERGVSAHPEAEGDLPANIGPEGRPLPALPRTHLERDAEPSARAPPGAARVSVPQQLCRFLSSGRGDRLSEEPNPGPFAPADSPLHH